MHCLPQNNTAPAIDFNSEQLFQCSMSICCYSYGGVWMFNGKFQVISQFCTFLMVLKLDMLLGLLTFFVPYAKRLAYHVTLWRIITKQSASDTKHAIHFPTVYHPWLFFKPTRSEATVTTTKMLCGEGMTFVWHFMLCNQLILLSRCQWLHVGIKFLK